jgi:hypothetical protein
MAVIAFDTVMAVWLPVAQKHFRQMFHLFREKQTVSTETDQVDRCLDASDSLLE